MSKSKSNELSVKSHIIVKGAKVHNLKNIDVAISKKKLTVITGLSGSGKSSLAFDTLFAEGQRRYVESLSSYARQFLGKLEKPDVEHIYGITPAIAIEQKVNTVNKRSTIGTSTEIYDYLKLLFARIGITYSPISGDIVKRHSLNDVVNFISNHKNGSKIYITIPLLIENNEFDKKLDLLKQQGYTRLWINNKVERIDKLDFTLLKNKDINVLIDRVIIDENNTENISRIYDSVETAFFEGKGICEVVIEKENVFEKKSFSNKFELDGVIFHEPDVNFFSFNNPVGACKTCDGYGSVIGIDEDLVIPNKSLSVFEDAIVCWKGEKMQKWKNDLVYASSKFDFPIHKPIYDLNTAQYQLLWEGNKHFEGLNDFFKMVEGESYKIQYRVMLSRYRGKTVCNDCKGTRLRKDANYVKVANYTITDLVLMPISQLNEVFLKLPENLTREENKISNRLIVELKSRIEFLNKVGLGYLTLNRLSSTLSGGESQRINLATSLGSSLVGSTYVLDEPSIGLHSKDTDQLIDVLKSLRDIGNTVLVVEHDEDIIKTADEIIDLGPEAGHLGGELVFQGSFKNMIDKGSTLTANYFNGKEKIEIPTNRRKWNKFIEIKGARENNLKGIDVKFPLHTLTVVTGVSGSGKSSLIKNCLLPIIKKMFDGYTEKSGNIEKIEGDIKGISGVEFVNQNPIGKSSRSNPVTYIKAYDEIRNLYSSQKLAKVRGLKPAHFSFNVDGGRCDNCKGEGEITVEMQFMSDIYLKCEECNGSRFKNEILEIKYNGKNIAELLELTIDEAISFFDVENDKIADKIVQKLLLLQEVGLGYVHLGQSSSTLSGGEAQRVKLASFLSKRDNNNLLFIFDEPTTGLHFHDIKKLLKAFNALISNGHSVIVIEHNLDVVKCADWVIDLGPEGGDNGGCLLFEGVPEDLINCKNSYTGKYLQEKL